MNSIEPQQITQKPRSSARPLLNTTFLGAALLVSGCSRKDSADNAASSKVVSVSYTTRWDAYQAVATTNEHGQVSVVLSAKDAALELKKISFDLLPSEEPRASSFPGINPFTLKLDEIPFRELSLRQIVSYAAGNNNLAASTLSTHTQIVADRCTVTIALETNAVELGFNVAAYTAYKLSR